LIKITEAGIIMELIKKLFDPSKDIYRTIEKVINYDVSQEERLKAEITEYIVTDSIEDQFEKLLTKMQTAMDQGGQNEIGVWVSGFYGSGKSSFTKYLGLALDEHVTIDGIPFIQHLQNRLHHPQTKALLAAVAKRFPAAVVFLDLASSMLAGATMEEVSTVLYYKVLQWAGYSRNLKVAAFERKLKKDGRYEEFKAKVKEVIGVDWLADPNNQAAPSAQNDPLVVDSVIPDIAHQMYPQLFKSATSFSTETKDYIQFENDRVQEMLNIAREASGKEYVIFIIDEVGQYVASRTNLILNLDGLAKNLKKTGDGKVWIFGTAQQTLTEDDPRAAINSPELYKLKDRFPIQIDLESRDIKEICYQRLLGKSPEGAKILEKLFDQHGQALRHNTKLEDAKYYDSDFTKESFQKLYPFLPAHFDILLHLLGALAKSTGGIGLRSAIKVIQDILIEGINGQAPIVENSVGWLATTATIYDALEKDIRQTKSSSFRSVEKTLLYYRETLIHQEIAKTVAVLQLLGNLPITVHNVASLLQSGIDAPSRYDEVEKAVNEMINDPQVPFGQQDGNLCFFSEKLNDIEQERANLTLHTIETRRIFSEALRGVFSPLPSARLNGSSTISSGIKFKRGTAIESLDGENHTIQTIVELVDPKDYETARTSLIDESRHHTSEDFIYFIGRTTTEIDERTAEIYRCQEISKNHRSDPDQDVKKYCNSQLERAESLTVDLGHLLKKCLSGGSLIFRGQTTAVDSLDQDVLEACKKNLSTVAGQVFDRNIEAPIRVETNLAEKFLRNASNLSAITSNEDPLGLVKITKGKPAIDTNCKALLSIHDFIDQLGNVEGKVLLEHFTDAPFGWSQDTLRYLIAALFMAGEIKLRVSGREIVAYGQHAIDALKNNNSFKTVGVSLRNDRPSMDVLDRASKRLTDLVGDTVLPLEPEITKAAYKSLPQYQARFAPLKTKLESMKLPGSDHIDSLINDITDILLTDASDAPQRLGGEVSILYNNLKWAAEVDREFNQGLEDTIKKLEEYRTSITSLPEAGIPGQLREDLKEELQLLKEKLAKEDFYQHTPDLNTQLTGLQARTRDAAKQMTDSFKELIKKSGEELQYLPEWEEFTHEQQAAFLNELESVHGDFTEDLPGLKQLMNQEFTLHNSLNEIKGRIIHEGNRRKLERIQVQKTNAVKDGKTKMIQALKVPTKVTSAEQLDKVIQELQRLRKDLEIYSEIEITINFEDK
jgi:hypothetical protein